MELKRHSTVISIVLPLWHQLRNQISRAVPGVVLNTAPQALIFPATTHNNPAAQIETVIPEGSEMTVLFTPKPDQAQGFGIGEFAFQLQELRGALDREEQKNQHQFQKIQKELSGIHAENLALKRQVQDLQQEVSKARTENLVLREEMCQVEQKVCEREEKVAKQVNATELRKGNHELKEENEKLERRIEELKRRVGELEVESRGEKERFSHLESQYSVVHQDYSQIKRTLAHIHLRELFNMFMNKLSASLGYIDIDHLCTNHSCHSYSSIPLVISPILLERGLNQPSTELLEFVCYSHHIRRDGNVAAHDAEESDIRHAIFTRRGTDRGLLEKVYAYVYGRELEDGDFC